MANQADTNRVSIYYAIESTWNETPSSPNMQELPFTSDTLGHMKETVVPTTIRSDRTQEDIVRVGEDASGDLNFEFRHTIYDEFIALTLGASFTVVAITNDTSIAAVASNDSFTSPSGGTNFVTAGIVAGMWINVLGFTAPNNNGLFKVLTVASTQITVAGSLSDESPPADVDISAKMVRNGTLKRSVLLEKRWNDIGRYEAFTGMRAGQMNLSITSRQLVTGSFSFMGAKGPISSVTVAGSSSPAVSRPVLDASNNVGELQEGGSALTTAITNIQLSVLANLRTQPAVANRFPIGIGLGTVEVTGSLEAYFEDSVMWNKFFNHVSTSLFFRFTDAASRHIMFTFPRIFFAEGAIPTQGANQDVFLPLPWRASYDSTSGYVMQVDVIG